MILYAQGACKLDQGDRRSASAAPHLKYAVSRPVVGQKLTMGNSLSTVSVSLSILRTHERPLVVRDRFSPVRYNNV
jgi:hypothetical protein